MGDTMKYVVAWLNFFDNDLQMILVEARDPITAMIEGARQLINSNSIEHGGNQDRSDRAIDTWLNPMLKDIPEPEGYVARIKEIQEEFNNADQVIAVMLPITRQTFR